MLAAAGYNAGPDSVSTWVRANAGRPIDEFVEEIPYKETRSYVRRIVSNLAVYSALYADRPIKVPEVVPASYLDNIDF